MKLPITGLLTATLISFAAPATTTESTNTEPVEKYVVTIADDAAATSDSVKATAQKLGTAYEIRVDATYMHALRAFSTRLTKSKARKLAADDRVKSVERVQVYKAHAGTRTEPSDIDFRSTVTRDNVPWGLDRIDGRRVQDTKYKYLDNGQGSTVYFLDSGVRTTHNDFDGPGGQDRVTAPAAADFVNEPGAAPGMDISEGSHGTHVAAVIGGQKYGVAPNARLVSVKVLDKDLSSDTEKIVAGLNFVLANAPTDKPAVVNLSLGGPASDVIDDAVKSVIAAGIPVVVSAGNDGVDASQKSPGRVPEAITVTAISESNTRPWWSNSGPNVDLHAPGVNITSATNETDGSVGNRSGTSMAAPHVAGVAARLLGKHPTATPEEVQAALKRNATNSTVAEEPRPPISTPPGEQPPPGGAPVPPQQPGHPEPLTVESTTTKVLHASIAGQPTTSCPLSFGNAAMQAIPDGPYDNVLFSQGSVSGCGTAVGVHGEVKITYSVVHPKPNELKIDLIAPDGTRYAVRPVGTTGQTTTSVHPHLNEPQRDGQWYVHVTDTVPNDSHGSLNGWTLRI